MGWTSPFVLTIGFGGIAVLVAFVVIEFQGAEPDVPLHLFRIRAYTAGVVAMFSEALGRGGLQFMLILWLQGIWLPLHGYDFARRRCGPGSPWSHSPRLLDLRPHLRRTGRPLRRPMGSRPVGLAGSAVCYLLLAPSHELRVRRVRRHPVLLLAFLRHVLLPQPDVSHEQPSPRAARGRSGHERHLQELGPGPAIGIFFSIMTLGLASHASQPPVARPHRPGRTRRPAHKSPTCHRSARCSPPSWGSTPSRPRCPNTCWPASVQPTPST